MTPKTLIGKLLAAFLLFKIHLVVGAQGVWLHEGQNYIFSFTSLAYTRPATQREGGSFNVTFAPGTFSDNESVSLELFTNSFSDTPILDTFSGSAYPLDIIIIGEVWSSGSPPFWPGLHGLARITMLSGDAKIISYDVKQVIGGNVYSQYFSIPDPGPALALTTLDNHRVKIAWPTNSPDYALEFTTNLAALAWSNVTNSPTNSLGNYSVSIDIGSGCQFFRLHKP